MAMVPVGVAVVTTTPLSIDQPRRAWNSFSSLIESSVFSLETTVDHVTLRILLVLEIRCQNLGNVNHINTLSPSRDPCLACDPSSLATIGHEWMYRSRRADIGSNQQRHLVTLLCPLATFPGVIIGCV